MSFLSKLGLRTKEQRSWALYDWANSAFPTIMMTAILPIYYFDALAEGLPENIRTAYWGYTSAVAMTIIATCGPLLGAISDILKSKKVLLLAGTILGMSFSSMLATLSNGEWLLASIYFIIGNIGFALAEIVYDSILPFIANEEEVNRVSTAGYAVGYLGGGICLVICLAMIQMPELFGLSTRDAVRASFLCVAAWWGVFTVPLMRNIAEPGSKIKESRFSPIQPIKQNIDTLKKIRLHRNAFLFLLAYWAYSDGIGTVIKMAIIYGKEIGIGKADLIGAIVMVQFLGVPSTFAFGNLADRIGAKISLCIALVIYSLICTIAFFMTEGWQFWFLAFLLSMVQGAAQAISRSIFARLIPKEQSGEFFGFFSVSARFAGIFGPLIFGLLSQMTGSSRHAILAIVLLFVLGILILAKVEIPKKGKGATENLTTTKPPSKSA